MDHVDTCVVGAGVVGLAIARALSLRGSEVFVLDRETEVGQGISSRNSEVIHAGIYYPADSLKATFCVLGKSLLYQYCEARGVSHARCGKLIVATRAEEEAELDGILEKAKTNGVTDLVWWGRDELREQEPHINASRALFSPSTGIVSSHELMGSYLADIEAEGGLFVGDTRVLKVAHDGRAFVLDCCAGGQPYQFSCRVLVNSAGLGAQQLANQCTFLEPALVPPLHLCRGNYFVLPGKSPFRHLVYPVPEKSGAGLGIHATIDLGGQARFGPDVEYCDGEDYRVSTERLGAFYEAIRRYYPGLGEGRLEPGYVGIRPKLQGPSDAPRDFVIQSEEIHGIPGLIQLFGIESPGLTSSLAIADHVAELLSSPLHA